MGRENISGNIKLQIAQTNTIRKWKTLLDLGGRIVLVVVWVLLIGSSRRVGDMGGRDMTVIVRNRLDQILTRKFLYQKTRNQLVFGL